MVNTTTNPPTLTRLGDLNHARWRAKLVLHGEYLYIFGGYNNQTGILNTAERMKIGEFTWSTLPNMKEARLDFGVYVRENRIYLLGGYRNTSIEYYDVGVNNFFLVENTQVPSGGIVCGLINDQLYAVGKQHLRVFSRDLQLIQSRDNINNSYHYCFSDVVVRGSNLFYINSDSSKVYSFDATSVSLRVVKEF